MGYAYRKSYKWWSAQLAIHEVSYIMNIQGEVTSAGLFAKISLHSSEQTQDAWTCNGLWYADVYGSIPMIGCSAMREASYINNIEHCLQRFLFTHRNKHKMHGYAMDIQWLVNGHLVHNPPTRAAGRISFCGAAQHVSSHYVICKNYTLILVCFLNMTEYFVAFVQGPPFTLTISLILSTSSCLSLRLQILPN